MPQLQRWSSSTVAWQLSAALGAEPPETATTSPGVPEPATVNGNVVTTPEGRASRVSGREVGGGDGVLDGGSVSAGLAADGAAETVDAVAGVWTLVADCCGAVVGEAAAAGGASPISPTALSSSAARVATVAKDTSPIDPRRADWW